MSKDNFHHDLNSKEVRQLVKQFESMLKNSGNCFFEQRSFQRIIEYYEGQFEYQKAFEVVNMALEQHPYSAVFLIKKAQFFYEMKQCEDALTFLDTAEVLAPNEMEAILLRGEIYNYLGRIKEAIELLENALSFGDSEEKVDILLALCEVHENDENEKEAFESILRALDIQPTDENVLHKLDFCVEMLGNYEESINIHKRIINIDPYCYLAWYNLANAYYSLQLYEKAVEAYEFVTVINDKYDLAYRDCGDAYFEMDQYGKAKEQFLEALKLEKEKDDELYYNIGICAYQLNDYPTAIKYFTCVIEVVPSHSDAYFQIGECFRELEEWDNAFAFYNRAVKFALAKDEYLIAIAELHYDLENYEMSVVAYREAIEVNQNDVNYWIGWSKSFFALELFEEALQIAEIAQKDLDIEENAELLIMIATSLFALGKKRLATTYFIEALQIDFKIYKTCFELLPKLKYNPDILSLLELYREG